MMDDLFPASVSNLIQYDFEDTWTDVRIQVRSTVSDQKINSTLFTNEKLGHRLRAFAFLSIR